MNDLKRILSAWELGDILKIEAANIQYDTEREAHIWTVNDDFLLKMNRNESEVKNNILISNLLNRENVPVQKVIKTTNGLDYIQEEDKYFLLLTKLKGQTLKNHFEGEFLERGLYIGSCIAELHKGLRNITEEVKSLKNLFDNNMYEEICGWVKGAIDEYIVKCKLSKEELNKFSTILQHYLENFEEIYKSLPRQVIHRDMHGENMIFQDGKLVGYIDFDLGQINTRLFDLCYMCTGILSGCFDNEALREQWLLLAKQIIKGYNMEFPLSPKEMECILYMFYSIELIMIAYFARCGYADIADTNIRMVNWLSDNWRMS